MNTNADPSGSTTVDVRGIPLADLVRELQRHAADAANLDPRREGRAPDPFTLPGADITVSDAADDLARSRGALWIVGGRWFGGVDFSGDLSAVDPTGYDQAAGAGVFAAVVSEMRRDPRFQT